MEASEHAEALEYTPTWVLAAVCAVIVFISLLVERGLHFVGKVRFLFTSSLLFTCSNSYFIAGVNS